MLRGRSIVARQMLLSNHLKALKLPTFAGEYEKVAMEPTQDRADYPRYLLRDANWSASIASAATSSGAFGWRAFHRPRASIRST